MSSYVEIQLTLEYAIQTKDMSHATELLEKLVEHIIEQSKIYPLDRYEVIRNYGLYQELKRGRDE